MDPLVGCLLGTAVGDALGLCREGLSRRRGRRLYPDLERYQLFAGRGMGSDDTDHAALTAWAALTAESPADFRRRLRKALVRWLWALPAGIGLATLRAGCKMTLGLAKSGVGSAGNGPVMRAPVLGAWSLGRDVDLPEWVRHSTELTHTDARAFQGSLLIARLTRALAQDQPLVAADLVDDAYLREAVQEVLDNPEEEVEAYAERRGWAHGVSGFVYHTVPVAVKACLRHRDDFARAVQTTIECGGDTDTTAAIVGGVLGTRLGKSAIPAHWLEKHRDWPVSLEFLESLPARPRLPSYPAQLTRNLVFGGAVLGYGLRRLLPPY